VHQTSSTPHVLIADDHFDTRVILRHYFEAMGFRVSEASNGEEALASLGVERPDALVLDIQMPKLDGIGVLRALRADPALADLKVLALSAHAMVGEVREITLAGVDRYMAKPADPRDVLEAVCTLIGREREQGGPIGARPRR
jgi:CheY-like chemotaxis protein